MLKQEDGNILKLLMRKKKLLQEVLLNEVWLRYTVDIACFIGEIV